MSTSKQRRERAQSWLQSLPPEQRPDATDVAMAAGLNVSGEVLQRMTWNDYHGLVRNWGGLLTAIRSDGTASEQQQTATFDAPKASGAAPPQQEPDEGGAPAAEKGANDPRRSELEAYLASQRAAGEALAALDDEWVDRALASRAEAWLGVSLRIQRKHKGPIERILAGADSAVETPRDVGGYDVRPSLDRVHQARHPLVFSGALEAIRLAWPAMAGAGVTAFRVQAGMHGERPVNYDSRHVGTTGTTELTDDEVMDGGRRFYQVWAYRAADERSARSTAPELWAEGVLLDSVSDVRVDSHSGQVSGTWVSPQGAGWVEVYRIPKREYLPHAALSQRHRVGGASVGANLTGFTDVDVPPGDYVYVFVAAADIDGATRHSLRVELEQVVLREMPEVKGFTATRGADGESIVVGWELPADPGHRVEIHLAGREVSEGAQGRELDMAALARAGLDDDTRRSKPPQELGGRGEVVLDWPDDIPRVHVVLVSKVDDAYRISGVHTLVRSQPITEVKLMERVDEQFLTFAWPQGAGFVRVYEKPEGAPDDPATWSRLAQISEKAHASDGGISLRGLPATGATLAIAGLNFEATQEFLGPMLVLRYPGLTRIRYRVEVMSRSKGLLRRARTVTGLRLEVEATPAAALNVHLVHRIDRLPLHGSDGTRLERFTLVPEGGTSRVAADVPAPGQTGFVRLFVDVPDDQQAQYAVLDPAADELVLGGES